jgi:hypothetical protein
MLRAVALEGMVRHRCEPFTTSCQQNKLLALARSIARIVAVVVVIITGLRA